MPPRQQFDFSLAMRHLCEDITQRMPEFSHIRMDHVAVAFAQARRRVDHGLQAKLTPMRFENGHLTTRRGRNTWTIQRLFHRDREILYILTFYLPRFQDQSFEEKMITVLHELQHISPHFNGDIRRHEGRYHVHTSSCREYDREMAVLARKYLARRPPKRLYEFLKPPFAELESRYGGVVGLKIPIPKLVPVNGANMARPA